MPRIRELTKSVLTPEFAKELPLKGFVIRPDKSIRIEWNFSDELSLDSPAEFCRGLLAEGCFEKQDLIRREHRCTYKRYFKKFFVVPILTQPAAAGETASSDESTVVSGFDMGADDYVAKPFRPRELVSRIRSVLRRCGRDKAVVTLGDVQADIERGQVTKNGADVYLTALEYRPLLVFVNNRGKVLSRSRLLEEIWDVAGDFVNDNTLTVYIKRLREKIETDPAAPQIIRTVRGSGISGGAMRLLRNREVLRSCCS